VDFFLKHQTLLLRVAGIFMLVVGCVVYFWTTPKDGVSANELAQKNLQRMEASVRGGVQKAHKAKPDPSHIAKAIKSTRSKQLQYVTILAMVFGLGFLLYSFISPKRE